MGFVFVASVATHVFAHEPVIVTSNDMDKKPTKLQRNFVPKAVSKV
jgi:hypothetical protein